MFDAAGTSVELAVTAHVGGAPVIGVRGDGCVLARDGRAHVRAGSGCVLTATEGESNGVQWRLPGGAELTGSRLYGQFVRRGEYQILVSRDEGAVDALAVVIE